MGPFTLDVLELGWGGACVRHDLVNDHQLSLRPRGGVELLQDLQAVSKAPVVQDVPQVKDRYRHGQRRLRFEEVLAWRRPGEQSLSSGRGGDLLWSVTVPESRSALRSGSLRQY